ncbi:hypothetical protein AB5I41_13410 [Sphingomonas sp. MMS24-JH45]
MLNGGSIRLSTPVAATTELDVRGTGTIDLSGQANTIAETHGQQRRRHGRHRRRRADGEPVDQHHLRRRAGREPTKSGTAA